MVDKKSKTPGVVINQIRAAILDGLYKPGDRLMEADLAEQFHVSRSPVREALQALESEGTLSATPYAGAIVRPLSAAEASEIADIRLGLISLALKPAHPHLAPAHFDLASDLAKRITRTKSPREAFECNRRFWDIIFENAERPIAVIFAYFFLLLVTLVPDAFNKSIVLTDSFGASRLLYFSFATITTTGYGDIAPVHPLARSLANLEAVIGQLFPATLLARIVTLEISAERRH